MLLTLTDDERLVELREVCEDGKTIGDREFHHVFGLEQRGYAEMVLGGTKSELVVVEYVILGALGALSATKSEPGH